MIKDLDKELTQELGNIEYQKAMKMLPELQKSYSIEPFDIHEGKMQRKGLYNDYPKNYYRS